MIKTQNIDIETLRQLIRYDPETGKLHWNFRDASYFSSKTQYKVWNKRFAHKEAFTADCGIGYRQGAVLGVGLKAHRVCWALYYGEWPENQIDHINHDRADNRIVNLRNVTVSENCRNRSRPSNNVSGYIGVSAHGEKWVARLKMDGVDHYLGLFSTIEDAVAARRKANSQNAFHQNHGS
jgi:hypothetical protein